MTKIYLVRHAEAEGNLYRLVQGHFDGLVTKLGYDQIRALRRRFENIPIDAVYSSDLFRARTTARAVSEPRNLPFSCGRTCGRYIWAGGRAIRGRRPTSTITRC